MLVVALAIAASPTAELVHDRTDGVPYSAQEGTEAPRDPWVVYEPDADRANGKHVVLLAGDEEYRSEEGLPMLGRILALRHGYRCTVLFPIDPETGVIDPEEPTHLPGLAALDDADLMIVLWRFRAPRDEDMRHFVDYVESGRPIVGLRTSTHAFEFDRHPETSYRRWSWRNPEWPGGFGRQVLGETWVAHHGGHGRESTRGVVAPGAAEHPILRGVDDVWGPSDVYTVRDLPDDATVLLLGQVCAGMTPDAPPVEGEKNDPMVPLAWAREIEREDGPPQRVVCTTMGASQDLASAGLRRLLVNACHWCLREEVPREADVAYVGPYSPTPFGFGRHAEGLRPADLAWPPER